VNPKRSVVVEKFEIKEVANPVGGLVPRWFKPPITKTHFNIANNDLQVFFFVYTFAA